MSEKDKRILNLLLLYVSYSDAIEDEVAAFVQNSSEDEITKEEFHSWIASFEVK